MAIRPVFGLLDSAPYVSTKETEFKYYSGFALPQAQKSVKSLHEAFSCESGIEITHILEISSKSSSVLGTQLSAFNLQYCMNDGSHHSVETIFQSGKCFENGKQYIDLLFKSSYDAKKDERLRTSGSIVQFSLDGIAFPIEPTTFFYDWLYINALHQNDSLVKQIVNYEAFTDIAFNPKRSWNCQARSAAVYTSLYHCGLLKEALNSPNDFRKIVYGETIANNGELLAPKQLSLFDVEL